MNERQYQLVKVIQKIRLFGGFDLEDIKCLLQTCNFKAYESGQEIYKAGEPSREMMILLAGRLNVVSASGERLAEIGPGASVGEMGVFTGELRSASVVADEPVTVLAIARLALSNMLDANPGMHLKVLANLVQVLSERLVETNKLNNEHLETIMKMQSQLVQVTGKTSRDLEEEMG